MEQPRSVRVFNQWLSDVLDNPRFSERTRLLWIRCFRDRLCFIDGLMSSLSQGLKEDSEPDPDDIPLKKLFGPERDSHQRAIEFDLYGLISSRKFWLLLRMKWFPRFADIWQQRIDHFDGNLPELFDWFMSGYTDAGMITRFAVKRKAATENTARVLLLSPYFWDQVAAAMKNAYRRYLQERQTTHVGDPSGNAVADLAPKSEEHRATEDDSSTASDEDDVDSSPRISVSEGSDSVFNSDDRTVGTVDQRILHGISFSVATRNRRDMRIVINVKNMNTSGADNVEFNFRTSAPCEDLSYRYSWL